MFIRLLLLLFGGLVHGQQCIRRTTTAIPTTTSSTTRTTTTTKITTTPTTTTSTTKPTTTTTSEPSTSTTSTITTTTNRCGTERLCPTSYAAVGQLCYALMDSGENQKLIDNTAARQICKDSGGHLPHFNTSVQYQCYLEWRKVNVHNHPTWLDYYNYQSHSPTNAGVWKSESGFVPGFLNWDHIINPSNTGGDEFCTHEWENEGWNDLACTVDSMRLMKIFVAVVCQS